MSSAVHAVDLPSKWTATSKESWRVVPGDYPPTPNPRLSPIEHHHTSITDAVRARKKEYVRKKKIKVKVGTWNVAAVHDTHKDLGSWFIEGCGIRGFEQDLASLKIGSNSPPSSDSELESIEEQEARYRKKSSTMPEGDKPAIAAGQEVDLYVLGLQEVVDVSSMTEAVKPFTDPNPARRWKKALKRSLPRGYDKIAEHQLLGLLILVYASPRLAPEISSVHSTSVGTGLMGYLGNKGAVSIRILVGETTRMVFVNSHLAAGSDKTALDRRIWDTESIISRTSFPAIEDEAVGRSDHVESIGDEDFCFWFGDLNYRLDDIPGHDVRRLLLLHTRNEYDVSNGSKRKIDRELGYLHAKSHESDDDHHYESNAVERPASASQAEPPLDPELDPASLYTTLKALLAHDQLHAQQRQQKVFHEGWREGEINFLPTYKYDVGSVAMFDSGEKKRSPSWCDRILYRTRADFEAYRAGAQKSRDAQKRDLDMRRRGIDEAAQQENILFDYDPAADGEEDGDARAEYDENGSEAQPVQSADSFDGEISVEEYVSHQRVLSSDHKPLSAVFSLTYESVDRDLKARVQQDVTKRFDRFENESQPEVTLVFDSFPAVHTDADMSPDDAESGTVSFGRIAYGQPVTRHITVANTGPIPAILAFVANTARPVNTGLNTVSPSWLAVTTEQAIYQSNTETAELVRSSKYRLEPGDTMDFTLAVHAIDVEIVKKLNKNEIQLNEILILRVLGGRDHFIPIKADWLQTCFFRSIDELIRVPSGGVRSLLNDRSAADRKGSGQTIHHSAPRELFVLTEAITPLVERVITEWDIRRVGDDFRPWYNKKSGGWPFRQEDRLDDFDHKGLLTIRTALDLGSSIDIDTLPTSDPCFQLELLTSTFVSFLMSIPDGLIPHDAWHSIDTQIAEIEKRKHILEGRTVQDIIMDVVSSQPAHSVSLTFVTFMLTQIIDMIISSQGFHNNESMPSNRARSSTSASAMSNVSLSSASSATTANTKRSFLPSLTRRSNTSSSVMSDSAPTSNDDHPTRENLALSYATIFAPILFRSEDSSKMKPKHLRAQEARKVMALQALLNLPP